MVDPILRSSRRLNHSWLPFFARFGKLNALQEKVVPRILEGKNLVIASPTASGKTEAVVAPASELLYPPAGRGLLMVYVVPTRALANDMLTRIGAPLEEMGFSVALKHGDHPSLPSSAPSVLITTPESLDSLACRRPRMFSSLRTLVLDEIHLFDGTPRGDQIRILIGRLKILAGQAFSVHLLSATMADPAEVAGRYVNCFEVVQMAAGRDIDFRVLGSLDELHELAVNQQYLKVLCFCNTREAVERTAAHLADLWKPHPVVPHHGSLSKQERERAESIMKDQRVAVCVATSTLEMGIDIGSIDLVALAEPPWTLAALLQRVGRGCRRRDCIVAAAIAESDNERDVLTAMFAAAVSGLLPQQEYKPDLSVAVQQIFSILFQTPTGMTEAALADLLRPIASPDEVAMILRHLLDRKLLEFRRKSWFAAMQVMDFGEKGKIHSNLPDNRPRVVINVATGAEIGRIAGLTDHVFLLARRAWRVVSVGETQIRVEPYKGKASPPVFVPHRGHGAFFHYLPAALR